MAYGAASSSRVGPEITRVIVDGAGVDVQAFIPVDANGDPVDISALTITVGVVTPPTVGASASSTGALAFGALSGAYAELVNNAGPSNEFVKVANGTDTALVIGIGASSGAAVELMRLEIGEAERLPANIGTLHLYAKDDGTAAGRGTVGGSVIR